MNTLVKHRWGALLIPLMIGMIASSGSAEDFTYTMEPGVRLGRQMRPPLNRIAQSFARRTGRRIHITSGTRTPREQADAMYEKIRRGIRLTRLYRNYDAASEIQNAYRRNRRRGRRPTVRAMAAVIRAQIGRGVYISRHLRASAADVRSRNLSRRERHIFREVVRDEGGVSLLQEGRPPHFHLQLAD